VGEILPDFHKKRLIPDSGKSLPLNEKEDSSDKRSINKV
jgi:hypothetical protein